MSFQPPSSDPFALTTLTRFTLTAQTEQGDDKTPPDCSAQTEEFLRSSKTKTGCLETATARVCLKHNEAPHNACLHNSRHVCVCWCTNESHNAAAANTVTCGNCAQCRVTQQPAAVTRTVFLFAVSFRLLDPGQVRIG